MRARTSLAMTAGNLVAASYAQAGLMGHDLVASWRYPSFGTVLESHVVRVSSAVELPHELIRNSSTFDLDIGDGYVTWQFVSRTNWTNTGFNGWRFDDKDGTIEPILGCVIDSFSPGIGNLGAVRAGGSMESFWVDLGGMTVRGPGDFIRFRVIFVPAPGAVSLLWGIVAFGIVRRPRRAS